MSPPCASRVELAALEPKFATCDESLTRPWWTTLIGGNNPHSHGLPCLLFKPFTAFTLIGSPQRRRTSHVLCLRTQNTFCSTARLPTTIIIDVTTYSLRPVRLADEDFLPPHAMSLAGSPAIPRRHPRTTWEPGWGVRAFELDAPMISRKRVDCMSRGTRCVYF
jgi:hypothetical protein